MDFTKEEKDIINKAMTDVTTTFAIMSEPDKKRGCGDSKDTSQTTKICRQIV